MTADHLKGIEEFEAGLWKIADNLRANSNLASNEYFIRSAQSAVAPRARFERIPHDSTARSQSLRLRRVLRTTDSAEAAFTRGT